MNTTYITRIEVCVNHNHYAYFKTKHKYLICKFQNVSFLMKF